MFQIDRRWIQSEVIDISNGSTGPTGAGSQNGALPEPNGATRASRSASRPPAARRAPVRAQIALLRFMTTVIETDCPIRAGDHALLTAGTAIGVDLHNAGIGAFCNGGRSTYAQTHRPTALLANADHELEPLLLMRRRDPINTITKDSLDKTVFQLAGSLAGSTACAAFQVNRQGQLHSKIPSPMILTTRRQLHRPPPKPRKAAISCSEDASGNGRI